MNDVRLCGYQPFSEESNEVLFEKIKKAEFEFASPDWDPVSDSAKHLIKNLLMVDPKRRFNADKILGHPWIMGNTTGDKSLIGVTKKISEMNAKNRLRV